MLSFPIILQPIDTVWLHMRSLPILHVKCHYDQGVNLSSISEFIIH